MRRILSGFIFAFTMLLAISSWARPCVTIKLVSLQGIVEARQAGQNSWQRAKLDEAFCIGDSIRTGSKARAALVIASDNTYVRLDQLTTLTLAPEASDNGIFAELARGIAYFLTRTPRSLKVQTPFVNAAVRGTEFVVRADSSQASVTVLEGSVLASNANGQLPLASGESAIAAGGQAPKARLDIAPRDTVMWALYYPPLFDSRVLKLDTPWIEPLRQSAAAYLAGDIATAFEQIRAVPESVSDARFLNYRAGLLLSVGRLDEAQADIQRSLATSNGNAHALALQSVIALAQNNRNEALQLARQAASADAESTPALSALSYAQQARFDINAARASIETALQHDRENVLLWARLSELWLALGDMPNALAAADRAVTLNPNVARTQSVLGFVELTRANAKSARAAFEKAITFDSADPLPRLGLGLALIRMGELEAGRREIEIAVTLDPNNALIRSYLGKAYYEEKRGALAATQLDMAKALDANDPTPWFYDAIRKQSENRPVEALRDLQKSIALNDNRAVYRSRLLLDQDLAARGASLARIYSDLGFEQLALREATKSLSVDPADHSAHRFLADAYSGMRRHEIARASEALQSQLLQPLNLNPVPLQLSETNTNILSGAGPTAAGFNEFNPLFERNRFALRAAGVVGSNGTRGDELIHSGLQDNVSYSLGQFHYETDGFRPNNGLKLDIYNAFVQTAITPQSNLQFEWRSRRQENGDLAMQFDATNFSSALHEETKEKTVRLGYRFTPSPKAGLILSAIRRETDSARQDARTIFAAAPFVGHREYTKLIDRAEAVFKGTDQAKTGLRIALEIKHGIDDMLEHARPGQRTFFSHMADENQGDAILLGEARQGCGAFAHLRHAAGCRLKNFGIQRLNRVDDGNIRLFSAQHFDDALKLNLGEKFELRMFELQPIRAQRHLLRRFLAADIDRTLGFAQARERLQQQCRFADAGIAANQYDTALYEAATEHTVKFRDARRIARNVGGFDRVDRLQCAVCGERLETRFRLLGNGFEQGIPGRTLRTLALPFGTLCAAGAANENALVARHLYLDDRNARGDRAQ